MYFQEEPKQTISEKLFASGRKRKMDIAAIEARAKTEKPLEIEKGDWLAMMVAGFVVFMPFVLLICGGLFLVTWLFTGRFL